MDPSQQKEYWDARIASWDSSAYARRGAVPWIERLAGPFRGDLRERKAYALRAIAEVAPRSLLELGCGTGELFASLPADTPVQRYVGVDVSPVAVQQARARAAAAAGRLVPEFVASPLSELDPDAYADFALVTAMGLLPYLTDGEVDVLARLLRGKRFLFDYHRAGASVWNALHFCYRRVAGHPSYRMHSDAGIAGLLRERGVEGVTLRRHGHLSFVQRLDG
jgi:SAM-dependent methyltransferase